MTTLINPAPLSPRGKIMVLLNFLGLIIIWGIGIYAFFAFTDPIPTHFDAAGRVTTYGSKSTFLIVSVAFSISPACFILLAKYRFTLINKYPYLVNLPAFFLNINNLSPERRSFWTNQYFELMLMLGAVLTLYMVTLTAMIFQGTIAGSLFSWFTTFSIIFPLAVLIPFFIIMQNLSRKIKSEAEAE